MERIASWAGMIILVFSITTIAEAQTMKNEGLNAKHEKIITIAAFIANGDLQKLKTALNEGLDAGLTVNEIKEILVQMYAYCAFPRSLNGINTFMSVMEERQAKGIKDKLGKEPSPMPANMNKNEYGAKVRAMLAGQEAIPPPAGYQLFTPVIDTFLQEHLFADIFSRDNLDFQNRELATISALASMTGTASQLRFHLGAAMNTGLTEAQMKDFISVLKSRVGKKEAESAEEILSKVLSDRQTSAIVSTNLAGDASGSGASRVSSREDSQTIVITRSGSQPSSKGPAEYFIGSVQIDPLFKANDPLRASGGRVTFEPGARTAWHSHPYGQILIVTAGSGWIQQWDGPIEEIREGDVVHIPPGLKHWHGATSTTRMTHIALQEQLDGKAADWMEKVSDEQYRK
ncbi:MAG TPA: carboxymuconolactone decarboxylase family protein [Nitrospirota bacterium]|nr:carboxymuconolactone decarboxylase family protein [Nitrospirota bacterium]